MNFDFKDEITTDRKVKELITLHELLQNEAIKHAEHESDLKKNIEELQQKLAAAADEINAEYEKKISGITAREEGLSRAKSELEARTRLLEHNLSITENALKLKEEEFLKIQREKEEQVGLETSHLSGQINWLKVKLGEETAAHTENVRRKNAEIEELRRAFDNETARIRRGLSEKDEAIERARARESDLAVHIRELTGKLETSNNLHFNEKETLQKEIESKKNEIQALRDALMNFQVKSEAASAALNEEFASIKGTFDSITGSLETQIDEKQKYILSLETQLARDKAFLTGYEERINNLVVELEREKAHASAAAETSGCNRKELLAMLTAAEEEQLKRFKTLKAELETARKAYRTRLDALQSRISELETESAEHRKKSDEITSLKAAAGDKDKLIKSLGDKCSILVKEYDQLSAKMSSIVNTAPPPAARAVPPPSAQEYLCSACGAPVDPGAKGCATCGVAFHSEP